jgi:hypothetical protein
MKSLILLLAISLSITNAVASEDNDDNPDCPYILDDVQTCAEKSLLMLKAEQAMKERQLKVIQEDVKQSFANVPEPTPVALLGLACLFVGVRKGYVRPRISS